MRATCHESQRTCCGFTLIEILVVTTIIGILAGLVSVSVASSVRAARKAHASSTALNLRNSVSAYNTEYRRKPLPVGVQGENDYEDFATNEAFMEILLGANTATAKARNPRRTKYFSSRTARRGPGNTFTNGIALNEDGSGAGSLWDYWGRMYGVRIDTSRNDQLLNPALEKPVLSGKGAPVWGEGNESGPGYLSESVVVWSSGKNPDRSADNIATW